MRKNNTTGVTTRLGLGRCGVVALLGDNGNVNLYWWMDCGLVQNALLATVDDPFIVSVRYCYNAYVLPTHVTRSMRRITFGARRRLSVCLPAVMRFILAGATVAWQP